MTQIPNSYFQTENNEYFEDALNRKWFFVIDTTTGKKMNILAEDENHLKSLGVEVVHANFKKQNEKTNPKRGK